MLLEFKKGEYRIYWIQINGSLICIKLAVDLLDGDQYLSDTDSSKNFVGLKIKNDVLKTS